MNSAGGPQGQLVNYEARLEDGTLVAKSDGLEFTVEDGGFGEKGKPAHGDEGVVPPNASLEITRSYVYFLCSFWTNDDNVRTVLHIRQGSIGQWCRCSLDIPHKRDIPRSFEYHVNLSRMGYRSLVYSGDHDLLVPFLATQAWIRS
ncbi:hypothetical protein ACSQ67_004240 [Phaseolus vulgaris]